ncbi:hypothetical protein [Leptolyngbya sp. PCC 6406]|uniref:hypothetical protein n=1 Tax=Leptolyngbya sp. PCC 6406 TaxID=1173264 RepID=UPI0002EBBEFC|nr:hypothetical protein [Leptolyngbya sp. PCC 6406]
MNDQLQALVLAIQGYSPETARLQRRKALRQLLQLLHQHRRLYQPSKSRLPVSLHHAYEEICDEAHTLLMALIYEEIDRYDPSRGPVLNWLRFHINRRCLSQAMKTIEDPIFSRHIRGSDKTQKHYLYKREFFLRDGIQEDGRELISTSDISEENPLPSEQVRTVLETDPQGEFRATCVRGNPRANFQVIALWRFENSKWDALATQLDEKVPTLSSFYQRSLKRFSPKIREYILDGAL